MVFLLEDVYAESYILQYWAVVCAAVSVEEDALSEMLLKAQMLLRVHTLKYIGGCKNKGILLIKTQYHLCLDGI